MRVSAEQSLNEKHAKCGIGKPGARWFATADRPKTVVSRLLLRDLGLKTFVPLTCPKSG
jgi:hypothetical protein